MRSSNKNRSRNKNGRKSLGNIINRVFESAGPEGKVRGTPQQIIEKYTMLSRDAQTAGDRIAAENFQQHAEHYIRILAEAQREAGIRQDQPQQGGGMMPMLSDYDDDQSSDPAPQPAPQPVVQHRPAPQPQPQPRPTESPLATIEPEDTPADTGLVETPENRSAEVPAEAAADSPAPRPRRAPRRRSARAKEADPAAAPGEVATG